MLVRWPVRMLYFHGPKQLGMWQGEGLADICARLTGVESIFWAQHPMDCEDLVNKKFNAFMITIQSMLYSTRVQNHIVFLLAVHLRLATNSLALGSTAPLVTAIQTSVKLTCLRPQNESAFE